MSQNVDIVRRVMRRISDGDLDAALGDVAPDAELDWSDSLAPDGGVYRGRAEWRAWFHGREEGLSELRFDATEVMDASSDTVLTVARLQARGRASGVEVQALGDGHAERPEQHPDHEAEIEIEERREQGRGMSRLQESTQRHLRLQSKGQ